MKGVEIEHCEVRANLVQFLGGNSHLVSLIYVRVIVNFISIVNFFMNRMTYPQWETKSARNTSFDNSSMKNIIRWFSFEIDNLHLFNEKGKYYQKFTLVECSPSSMNLTFKNLSGLCSQSVEVPISLFPTAFVLTTIALLFNFKLSPLHLESKLNIRR